MNSGEKNLFLRWKGAVSGPFTRSEISSMLDRGRAGIFYEIREDKGQWILLKDFDGAYFFKSGKISDMDFQPEDSNIDLSRGDQILESDQPRAAFDSSAENSLSHSGPVSYPDRCGLSGEAELDKSEMASIGESGGELNVPASEAEVSSTKTEGVSEFGFSRERQGRANSASELWQYFVYGLCGASFLSFWIYMACLVFAAISYREGNPASALRVALFSSLSAVAGFMFFHIFLPAVAS